MMDAIEAIHGRRSVGKVKPDEVDKALIEKVLDAAVQAPNHGLTQPWRFIVMTGEGRRLLGEAYARVAGTVQEADKEPHMKKAFRAPVVIAVVCCPSDRPEIVRTEEFAAVHASVQNMLLAIHALGLAAIWRSGLPMYDPAMKEAFGLTDREELVGLIYMGHPAEEPPARKERKTACEVTRWVDRV